MTHKTVINLQTVKQTHGGGFLVRKVIGGNISSCDPFIMLDHIGLYYPLIKLFIDYYVFQNILSVNSCKVYINDGMLLTRGLLDLC